MYAINLEQLSSLIIMSQIYFWMNLDQRISEKKIFDQLQNRPKLSKIYQKFQFSFFILFSNFATITLQTLSNWQAIFYNHFMVFDQELRFGAAESKTAYF